MIAPTPHAASNGRVAGHTTTSTPNDLIESMTGRRHLSWSQFNSYRGCPRRWFFSHVEGLQTDFVSSALVLGSAVHEAVQVLYEHRLEGQASELATLTEAFDVAWAAGVKDVELRYGKDEDAESAKATGHRMLAAFLASDLATPAGDLIAIEETLRGSIHPDLPDLVARIDVMWQSDDGLHLLDLKTSRSRWSAAKVDESAGPTAAI